MCVCVYVPVCVCVYIYLFIYLLIYVYICICIYDTHPQAPLSAIPMRSPVTRERTATSPPITAGRLEDAVASASWGVGFKWRGHYIYIYIYI